jgi:hypothetical protein
MGQVAAPAAGDNARMSAADSSFDELWSRAQEDRTENQAREKPRHQPAPNNVGVALLIIAVTVVLMAIAIVGPAFVNEVRQHTDCAAVASHQSASTRCSG